MVPWTWDLISLPHRLEDTLGRSWVHDAVRTVLDAFSHEPLRDHENERRRQDITANCIFVLLPANASFCSAAQFVSEA